MVGQSLEDFAQEFAENNLQDNVLVRNIHHDLISVEKSTGIEKPKYKLLTKRFTDLGLYFFYALTKTESACPQRAKIELSSSDYDFKKDNHLSLPSSYINLEKPVVEDREMLIEKIRRTRNSFECVARVTQIKLSEIKAKAETMRANAFVDKATQETILIAFGIKDISDEFVKKYSI